jgi:hypothetical protein
MGLDISAHPIDTALFRDRLIPFVQGQGALDDLIQRAVAVAAISHRANAWGLGAYNVESAFTNAQRDAAPIVVHTYQKTISEPSLLAKLFGAKAKTVPDQYEAPDRVPGLPGFDTDLAIWGRPFFIVADDEAIALADYERYLSLVGQSPDAVDALGRDMIARMEAMRARIPADTHASVLAAAGAFPAFPTLAKPDCEQIFNAARVERAYRKQAQSWRDIFAARGTKQTFNVDDMEHDEEGDEGGERWVQIAGDERPQPTADELLPSLPHSIVGFAAALLPGWMNRGSNHASFLFDKIGVKMRGLIETPEPLFAPLVKEASKVGDGLRTTIFDNFSLGGYVAPENVAAFVDLLEQHKYELSRAWGDHYGDALSPDYIKIIEPARYALKYGFGYIEAAEVYSAPLGMMN